MLLEGRTREAMLLAEPRLYAGALARVARRLMRPSGQTKTAAG
jgi:hypothetical protein